MLYQPACASQWLELITSTLRPTMAGSSSKPPPSPTASFYDMSDEDEEDYNTITHPESRRGVKLLFSKSKVYVHPSPSAKDNIPGFIALVQQKSTPLSERRASSASKQSTTSSNYLLAWVPESSLAQDDLSSYVKVDMKDGESPPRQTYLVPPLPLATFDASNAGPYAFSLPLSSIYSILVRPPSLGWWYGSIVINTRSGSSLPALFFHDSECESTILQKKKKAKESFDPFGEHGDLFWGGDEVIRWLKRYVSVERSTAEPSVFLIDPSEEDRIGFGQGRKSFDFPEGSNQAKSDQKKSQKRQSGPGMDPLTKTLKETRWKILEQLSKVTTLTRRTAEDLANNKNLPPQVRRLIQNPEVQTIQDEFDSARVYLARWALGIAEQSEKEKNQRIWTAKDILASAKEESELGDFEILDRETAKMSIKDSKRKPVDITEWKTFFDSEGRLQLTREEVMERVFHGGLDAEDGVRKEAWPFLLDVYDFNKKESERQSEMNTKRDWYMQLKGRWWDRMIDGNATAEQEEWWKEQKNRIEKDVHRTDRHIPLFTGEDIPHPDPSSPFYNEHGPGTNVHMEQLKDILLTYVEWDTPPPEETSVGANDLTSKMVNPHAENLGYVQGMSDLLAPLYAVFQDDALTFWCFVGFMRRTSQNFSRSQTGMRKQLSTLDQLVQFLDPELYLHLQSADSTNFFFFFRMLLVWYKREFEWSDVLRLWEGLWTDYLTSQFHIFIAMAILEKHRDVLIDHLKHFDEVLKYFNELSGTIDLMDTLVRAEKLFRRFESMVGVVEKGGLPTRSENIKQQRAVIASAPFSPSVSKAVAASRAENSSAEAKNVISPDLRSLLCKDKPM